jgi:hypothetical protein
MRPSPRMGLSLVARSVRKARYIPFSDGAMFCLACLSTGEIPSPGNLNRATSRDRKPIRSD